jgi:antitoxin (DNA-binding transcriptional repressor) of toxin-antitoxin stability system
MKMVGIAELKARLSEYLDLVKSGESVLVTERGRPVATLSRSDEASAEVDELVRSGVALPPGKALPEEFFDHPGPEVSGGAGLEALLEERREGR